MTEPLPLRALHHIALATRRPEETERFYVELLGFQRLERPPFDFRGAWLYGCGVQIHLIEDHEHAPAGDRPISSRADHLAFSVSDVAEVMTRLETAGVSYVQKVNAAGTHQVFVQDPDGHTVEFATYADPSLGYHEGFAENAKSQV